MGRSGLNGNSSSREVDMITRRMTPAIALAVVSVTSLFGLVSAASGPARADDQCIQRCIQLENQCRRTSKGQGNCDAVAAQCMASCRKPK